MLRLTAALLLSALALTACGGGTAPSAGAPAVGAPAVATGSGGDYCAAVRDSLAAGQALAASIGGTAGPEVIAQIQATNAAVLASAPPELRAEIEDAAGATTVLVDVLQRNGGDFQAALADPAFSAAVESVGTMGQASIEYNERVCGVLTGG